MRQLLMGMLVSGWTVAGLGLTGGQAQATTTEVSYRLNIAGQQRMLSQRIGTSACLAMVGIAPEDNRIDMAQSVRRLLGNQFLLSDGDAEARMPAEVAPSVALALRRVEVPILRLSEHLGRFDDGQEIARGDIDVIDRAGMKIQRLADGAVFEMSRHYAAELEALPFGLTNTLDMAGRQRMLIERGIKEACLATADPGETSYHARLDETVQLFDLSLLALREGSSQISILPPPSAEITRALEDLARHWMPVRAMLLEAALADRLTLAELERLSETGHALVGRMDRIVTLYEAAAGHGQAGAVPRVARR